MIRTLRLLAALLLVASPLTSAQTQDAAAIQRDPAAVATVQAAIDAMGGPAVAGIQDCTAEANVQPTPDAHSSPYTVKYTQMGKEFRKETVRDGQTTVTASDGIRYSSQSGAKSVEKLPTHLLYSEFPKHLIASALYRRLMDPSATFLVGGTGTVNGQPVTMVATRVDSDPEGANLTAQVWSFDAKTGLPLRVDWVLGLPQNANNTANLAAEFGDFRSVSGVLVPFQITFYASGIKLDVTTLTSVTLNTGVSPGAFQLGGVQ